MPSLYQPHNSLTSLPQTCQSSRIGDVIAMQAGKWGSCQLTLGEVDGAPSIILLNERQWRVGK